MDEAEEQGPHALVRVSHRQYEPLVVLVVCDRQLAWRDALRTLPLPGKVDRSPRRCRSPVDLEPERAPRVGDIRPLAHPPAEPLLHVLAVREGEIAVAGEERHARTTP